MRTALTHMACGLVRIILATGIALLLWPSDTFESGEWIHLSTPVDSSSAAPQTSSDESEPFVKPSYRLDALFVDLPSLKLEGVTGDGKFLSYDLGDANLRSVGYVIKLITEPIDLSKVPNKYKEQSVIQTKGGPVTVMPLEQATYEVHFVFRGLDVDGFELFRIDSPTHNVASGANASIQGQTPCTIPAVLAAKVDKLTLKVSVDKCLSAKE